MTTDLKTAANTIQETRHLMNEMMHQLVNTRAILHQLVAQKGVKNMDELDRVAFTHDWKGKKYVVNVGESDQMVKMREWYNKLQGA